MRSAVSFIQSLNWRTIFFGTLLSMILYLVFFEKDPQVQSIIPADLHESTSLPAASKGQDSKVKSPYDDRFDSPDSFEDPYPILGDAFDSPIDAIPGKKRPEGHPEIVAAPAPSRTSKKKGPRPKTKTKSPLKSIYTGNAYRPPPPPSAPEKPSPPEELVDEISVEASEWLEEYNKAYSAGAAAASSAVIPEDLPVSEPPSPPAKHDYDLVHADALTPPKDQDPDTLEPSNSDLQDEQPEAITPEDPKNNPDYTGYIAICAALKDVPLDLPEWLIHHYFHLNISKFYIMDDGSSPSLASYGLPDSIPAEAVVFNYQEPEDRTGGNSQQLSIYERCLQEYGRRHSWMAFIDGDEFLEMTAGNETLPELLEELEAQPDVGALAVNWRMHTSSGYLTRPDSARKAFVNCMWDGDASHNIHVKSIVRTQFAEAPINPHLWYLKNDMVTVGEYGDIVNGGGVESEAFRVPISRDRIALHHYAGKSREEYEEKMMRGNAMDDPKGEEFWDNVENQIPKVECPEMAMYEP